MGKLPPTIKLAAKGKRGKPAKAKPAAPADDLVGQRAAEIQDRMRLGKPVSPDEVRVLDAYLQGHGPTAVTQAGNAQPAEDDKAPEDVLCRSQNEIAALLGLHKNTLTNWKAKGIEPVGTMPWSLKAFLVMLRPKNKLPECAPTTPRAKALWKWAWGVPGQGSLNPDDPAHGAVIGWSEERDRQGALKEKVARQSAQVDLEKKLGRLKDDDEVRADLRALANLVIGELSSVQNIANQVRGLAPTQRADLGDALTQWQSDAKARIAAVAAKYAKAKETIGVVPG
jgi:hypothetical protein